MNNKQAITVLASLHDRGLLVPFIGSGMSMGPCVGWDPLIVKLEETAGIKTPTANADLIARAETVMQVLRRGAFDIPAVIREAVYVPSQRSARSHSDALARMRWPLICTTNYDDVYLRSAMNQAQSVRRKSVPKVRGRSEDDCRSVLQHIALPTGELVWCLQGFLKPDPFTLEVDRKTRLCVGDCLPPGGADLSSEIVLSHSEYRSVTHRLPHFRRCFAEVFRSRSLLFLGSGLTETYFRSLFDEVVELVGPTSRPHFALVRKGSLDPEFMRSHYHTILIEYELDKHRGHSQVGRFLERLAMEVVAQRVRTQAWGWKVPRASGPATSAGASDDMTPDFTVSRTRLPTHAIPGAIIGISCGRKRRSGAQDVPMPGGLTKERLAPQLARQVSWHGDYLVTWAGSQRWLRGIVARDPDTSNSREARSPQAVHDAFEQFLVDAQACGKAIAHVQLLSAGHLKTFETWMSLVQMARAYGRWAKGQHDQAARPLKVVVHLYRDDDVVALLNGGYLDIAEHLEDTPMRLFVEIVDASGRVQRQHWLVDAGKKLREVSAFRGTTVSPAIHALPVPRKGVEPVPFATVADARLSSLGLVSGSTLVADYRAASISAATERAKFPTTASTDD